MNVIKNIFFLFCILWACTDAQTEKHNKSYDTSCVPDPLFIYNYTNCILIITESRHRFMVDYNNRMKAIECLEAITSLKSNIIKFSDTPYLLYKEEDQISYDSIFEKEINQWITWLNKNHCYYNNNMAEMSFAKASKALNLQLQWPDPYYYFIHEQYY